MSTRSDIIVQRRNGKFARVYCHWDGYLEHNGKLLHENYNTQQLVEKLVAPGDMSSLGTKCTKPRGHTFDKPVNGFTVYYGRDRGERDTASRVFDSLAEAWPCEDTWTEFTYVWLDGQWWVGDADEGGQALKPLAEALSGDVAVTPHIKWPMVGTIGRHKPLAT
jgi:hypothetical protein